MTNPSEYLDGVLTIKIDYLLDAMSDYDKRDLAQRLSCEDAIIQHVADQITEGSTEDGSSGSTIYPTQARPSTPLDKAARQVAKASSEIARQEIERLERRIESQEKEVWKLREELSEKIHRPW